MDNERKILTADPSALGLFGLAIVTLVASSAKLGLTEGTAFILPWAILLGGCAQLFACFKDAQKGNAFGMTAFGAYGLFWIAVSFSWIIQLGIIGDGTIPVDPKQLGFAFLGYAIFSIVMTIASAETNKVLFVILIFIDVLFVCLTVSTLFDSHMAHIIAGYAELMISIFSFYAFAANILNGHFGYTFLPIGKPLGVFKK